MLLGIHAALVERIYGGDAHLRGQPGRAARAALGARLRRVPPHLLVLRARHTLLTRNPSGMHHIRCKRGLAPMLLEANSTRVPFLKMHSCLVHGVRTCVCMGGPAAGGSWEAADLAALQLLGRADARLLRALALGLLLGRVRDGVPLRTAGTGQEASIVSCEPSRPTPCCGDLQKALQIQSLDIAGETMVEEIM